jgi:hypothetical protein
MRFFKNGADVVAKLICAAMDGDANFDTLFKGAEVAGGLRDMASHPGRAIPMPEGEQDYGIITFTDEPLTPECALTGVISY